MGAAHPWLAALRDEVVRLCATDREAASASIDGTGRIPKDDPRHPLVLRTFGSHAALPPGLRAEATANLRLLPTPGSARR